MIARLTPLEPPYEPTIARALERMMGSADVEPLKLFRTVAYNEHVLDKFRSTGSYLLNFGTLDPIEREIVILRTCARCRSEYEWGVHVAIFADAVGLTAAQVAATVDDDAAVWTPRQTILIRLADELHDSATVSDALWSDLMEHWKPSQLVELLALAGQYRVVAYFTNALRIAREDFAPTFGSAARTRARDP
jgi:4-carboxymuconolactone decarboxylase